MKCRILYLVGQLSPGGSERQLYYLLKRIDRARYQPEVVVWNFCEADTYVHQIRALGVPLHSFPGGWSRFMKLRAFRRIVEQLKPEVVHSYAYTNFAAWWANTRLQRDSDRLNPTRLRKRAPDIRDVY
jgi:hypothetical protein